MVNGPGSYRGRAASGVRVAISLILAVPGVAQAFHPLATDDVGTQGGGGVEVELSALAAEPAGENDPYRIDLGLSTHAGLVDALDVGLTLTLSTLLHDGSSDQGIGDPVLDLKWRWLEGAGARPGLALRLDYKPPHYGAHSTRGHDTGALLIASWERARLAVHLNGGVIVRGIGLPGTSEAAGLGAATVTALLVPSLTAALELVAEATGGSWAAATALAGLVWRPSDLAAVSLGVSRSLSEDGHGTWSALAGVTAALGGS